MKKKKYNNNKINFWDHEFIFFCFIFFRFKFNLSALHTSGQDSENIKQKCKCLLKKKYIYI